MKDCYYPKDSHSQIVKSLTLSPKTVIHVITTLERGGAENQLLILVKAQIKFGFDVIVMPLKGCPELDREFNLAGAVIKDLRISKNVFSQVRKLRRLLPKEPHILHAHLPRAELISRFARSRYSVYLITRHFGGSFFPGKNRLLSKLLSRVASNPTKAIIAISNAVETQLVTKSEVKKSKHIEMISYGFDCQEFKRSSANGINLLQNKENSELVLGTIARLSDEKDYPTLFRAFRNLLDSNPTVSLRIAGVGPLADDLLNLAKELRIDNKVTWEGKIADTSRFLQEIDVFILASKFEGFGMVLLEAMCMHKPIVAAGNSALLEVLGDKGAGVFFETGDPFSLASKVRLAQLLSPLDYKGEQDQRLFDFSVDNLLMRTTSLYERIANSVAK